MTLVVAVEAGSIATITCLTYLSHKHDGFATVQYVPLTTLSDLTWAKIGRTQIWWTLIPAIFFSLLGLAYATIVAATAERQPYVELHNTKETASSARKTILLDYPTYALFFAWAVAWRNAHIRLSCSMFVQLLASIFLVSLASNLLRVEPVSHASNVTLESLLELDISTLNGRSDILAAMDVASAVHEYGTMPSGWMNEEAAVEPFFTVDEHRTGNISVTTSVYSAKLDCRAIDRKDINIRFDGTDASFLGSELISFTDGDCNVQNQGFPVSSNVPYYAVSWNQQCAIVSNMWNDRIGVFLGSYADKDPQKMSNFITVTCTPVYQNFSTTVSIVSSSGQVISIEPADPGGVHEMNQLNFGVLHSNIPLTQVNDNIFVSDSFGRKVYRYAQQLSGNGPIEVTHAVNATEKMYSTFFAALAQRQLFRTRAMPKTGMPGKLFSIQTRLKVVTPIAYILIGLLTLMLVCSVALFVLACTSISVLMEEPVGLLGRAILLMHSDVYPFISDVTAEHPNGRVVKTVKKLYSVKTSQCYMDDERVIHVSNLVEKPGRAKQRTLLTRRFAALVSKRRNVAASNEEASKLGSGHISDIALSTFEDEDSEGALRRGVQNTN